MRTKPCETCNGTGEVKDPLPPLIKCKDCKRRTRANNLVIYRVSQSQSDCGDPNGAYSRHNYDMFQCPKCGDLNMDHAPQDDKYKDKHWITYHEYEFKDQVDLFQDDYEYIENVLKRYLTTGKKSKYE